MTLDGLPIFDLPGPPGDAGVAHGRLVRDLLEERFREAYVRRLGSITRTERADLAAQAERWLAGLPAQHQEEIEGMGRGAGIDVHPVAEFLYADIARASAPDAPAIAEREIAAGPDDARSGLDGPMCSAVSRADATGATGTWIGRNCDWLFATLSRGVAGVVHRTPNRIPVLALGIRGDIDVDTGMNAEGLWLHLHTLPAMDDPGGDRTRVSWLFWAREALETCATLDDLERFIETTTRDRGVIVFASDGKGGDSAVFECARGTHTRVDQDGPWLIATNHPVGKPIDERRERAARAGSTVARFCALRRRIAAADPGDAPEGLMRLLGSPDVEMRDATHLRTIYAAIVNPSRREVWFSAGDDTGRPAASAGSWARVPVPF